MVTDIGEYVDKKCCGRNFKLRLNRGKIARRFPFYGTVRSPLNPILATSGRLRERELREALTERMRCINPADGEIEQDMSWAGFMMALSNLEEGEECFAQEVEIARPSGAFNLSGRMDFVILRWRDGCPVIRIVECKASRKDKTYHRIQLAAYKMMVEEALSEAPAVIAGRTWDDVILEAVVARIDGGTRRVQDALTMPPLDLSVEIGDLKHLVAPGGPLARIGQAELDELSYHLESKCDGCVHCPICMPESERQGRLELLGLDPVTVQALQDGGVRDINDLAELDIDSPTAEAIQNTPGLGADLDDLIKRARARRSSTPWRQEGDHSVISLDHRGASLLPLHVNDAGFRTIRIYLNVEYDYVEDRLVALCAHITDSDRLLLTKTDGEIAYPFPLEYLQGDVSSAEPLGGAYVIRMMEQAWTHDPDEDDAAEGAMLRSFFNGLSNAITAIAGNDEFRPLHLYVWSPGDVTDLVQACSRTGGELLRSLTELLGCREKCRGDLEQLIFTSLRDEIVRTQALGHTSLSLTIATGMKWYGAPPFHWIREVDGEAVDLTYAFKRDLFDFRTYLYLTPEGEWAPRGRDTPGAQRRFMEVRTRHSSAINAPYWYAMWGDLPELDGYRDPMIRRALQDYGRGGTPGLIRAMLMAKCEALRWLEERFPYKNKRIEKPMVPVEDIRKLERHFADRYGLVRACQDFLRLDHHINKSEWLANLSRSPAAQVAEGTCIPLRDVRFIKDRGRDRVTAIVDLERFNISPQTFLLMCGLGEGIMRISPYEGDLNRGPSPAQALYNGVTVAVTGLDIIQGTFQADVIPYNNRGLGSDYILPSTAPRDGVMHYALAGEPRSAFVMNRVDRWLEENGNTPSITWFNPIEPNVPIRSPPSAELMEKYQRILRDFRLYQRSMDDIQIKACLDGLESTVQLLLGPPGTGKTSTTAAAIMLRLAARPGHKLFLLSANTHPAVDELCLRLREAAPAFQKIADQNGVTTNTTMVLRLRNMDPMGEEEITCSDLSAIRDALKDGDVVLCGSVSQVLKLARNFGSYGWPKGSSRADGLIVDEASMMIFPDFLALSTLVAADGEIMLAGDHMQLSPITAHKWEEETREQVVKLCPHDSAYNAMRKISEICPEGAVRSSSLSITYRLTPELTHLISSVYRQEGVNLTSCKPSQIKSGTLNNLGDLWAHPGVYLVIHGECSSQKSNAFEAELIRDIFLARGVEESKASPETVSVITPHRAQRGLLKDLLSDLSYHIKLIDTVERLQGGECETIIVSGTQSESSAISRNADFILDLNRTNVIFSRAQERLIVVCSENLLNSVPSDIEDYASSWLWKHLRAVCDHTVLSLDNYEYPVEIRVPGKFWTRDGE